MEMWDESKMSKYQIISDVIQSAHRIPTLGTAMRSKCSRKQVQLSRIQKSCWWNPSQTRQKEIRLHYIVCLESRSNSSLLKLLRSNIFFIRNLGHQHELLTLMNLMTLWWRWWMWFPSQIFTLSRVILLSMVLLTHHATSQGDRRRGNYYTVTIVYLSSLTSNNSSQSISTHWISLPYDFLQLLLLYDFACRLRRQLILSNALPLTVTVDVSEGGR